MTPPPKVFISATSGDLRSIRALAREILLTINCHPVDQETFKSDWRTVSDMLPAEIAQCQALVHLVGLRYGAEPDAATLQPGEPRRSYTQREYHIGRRLQQERGDKCFRVYTFVLPENFPYDQTDAEGRAIAPEDEERTRLQLAHRAALLSDPHLRYRPTTRDALRAQLLAIQEQVLALRQEQTATKIEVLKNRRIGLWGAACFIFLFLGVVLGLHSLFRQNSSTAAKLDQGLIEVKSIFAEERRLMSLILARANERIKEWENMKPGERFDLALDQIAVEQAIPAKKLRALLDLYVQRVEIDPDAEAVDKYFVLMRKQAFGEAAQLAQSEGQTAVARMKQQASRREAAQAVASMAGKQEELERERAIDFYRKEGGAYQAAYQFDRALSAFQKAASPDLVDKIADPLGWANAQSWVASVLYNLARHKDAEPLMREVLHVREQHLGQDDPQIAVALNSLASLLLATNRHAEAESLMWRALKIGEARHGPDHSEVAIYLNNLALLLQATNRLTEAEPLFRRALKITEASYGADHPNFAIRLNNLALLLQATNRLSEAEPLMRRALKIDEASFGPIHPSVSRDLGNLAELLKSTNRLEEAEPLMRRALKIAETCHGADHPDVAISLNNLALLFQATNRPADAEPLMRRALKVVEACYGADHPAVAITLNNLALLLLATNRATEAEPLFQRALKIDEASYGPFHPNVAIDLNNLGRLLQANNRLSEAEPLMKRAIGNLFQFQSRTGHRSPSVFTLTANYLLLAREMNISEQDIHAQLGQLRQQAGLKTTAFEAIWQEVILAYPPFKVVITEVVNGGQAEALGLQAGDTYVSYNGHTITSTEQLIRLTGEAKGEAIPLEVLRAGKKLTFAGKPGKLGTRIENRAK